MIDFPPELWMKIFGNLGKYEWCALCMTCRFHIIARKCLFTSITLHNDVSFTRFITKHLDLAKIVVNLTLKITNREDTTADEPDRAPRSPSLSEIFKFESLRTLRLNGIRIDAGLCAALHRLENLSEVRYEFCFIEEDIGAADLTKWPTTLSKVAIHHPYTSTGWSNVIPSTISSFEIDIFASESDATRSIIVAEILQSRQNYAFTALSFGFAIPKNIVTFLVACPHLRKLSFSRVPVPGISLLADLPATALPCLEYFSGTSKCAELILPGRPVHTAIIHSRVEGSSDPLRSLVRSAVPLTTLVVHYGKIVPANWAPYHSSDWTDALTFNVSTELYQYIPPTVRRLRFVEERKWRIGGSWADALTKLRIPDLHTLELAGTGILHRRQKEFVETQASAVSLSLREVVFDPEEDHSECCRTWRRRTGSTGEEWVSYTGGIPFWTEALEGW